MLRRFGFLWMLSLVTLSVALLWTATAAEMPIEDAWKALPKYEYGNDMAVLLTIDREVIRAMATPASRSAWPRGWPSSWRPRTPRSPRSNTSAANFDKLEPQPRFPL